MQCIVTQQYTESLQKEEHDDKKKISNKIQYALNYKVEKWYDASKNNDIT